MKRGGGFLPIHSASWCFANEPKYDKLVGGRFESHLDGIFNPRIVDSNHEITKDLESFNEWDETYFHINHNKKNRKVLMVRDVMPGDPNKDPEPWTWIRTHGKGRVFYTASGHDERVWSNKNFQKLIKKGQRGVSPFFVPKMIPNIAGGQIAIKNNLHGLNFSMSTACSSATDAIGMAYRLISNGYSKAILCGGAEGSITPLTLSGFANMKALSKNNENPQGASRPFDKDRDGFILSEGAGMLMVEDYDEAKKRDANIIGEIIGYGITNDAFHITQPDNESTGASKAITMALNDAGINASEVGYINAHGTSTYFNDMLETQAIKKVFGKDAKNVSISSTNSMTGHLLGAAGAIEAITCLNAINHGIIPPTINYNNPDTECDCEVNIYVQLAVFDNATGNWVDDVSSEHRINGTEEDSFTQSWTSRNSSLYDFELILYDSLLIFYSILIYIYSSLIFQENHHPLNV